MQPETVMVEGVECVEVPYNQNNVGVFRDLARELNREGNICGFCPLYRHRLYDYKCDCSAIKQANARQTGGDIYVIAKYWPILAIRINHEEKGGPT